MKTAIFVEGQTELVFVREYLLKRFDYQDITLDCYTLFTDSNFHPTEYALPNENATHHFQIINVGNDNAVITRILRREKYLWNSGFNRIIGLRDMYSKSYRELVKEVGIIDLNLNEEFKQSTKELISKKSEKPNQIDFAFAIMEAESWILGFRNCFEKISPLLSVKYIEEQLGFNLETIDPETTFFHPAKTMEQIYSLADKTYKKSKGNIEAIMASLQKVDFENLKNSTKCSSFKEFAKLIP
ncbi:hypothetical protein [Hugenholtzia roseola]|uniref:hypothetical protein n=1 Tax=Hugenholtzia roseola TaxID=1002 RepID=UPI00047EAE3B|nr:hypothetical protein [Hugenholtzia roseola]